MPKNKVLLLQQLWTYKKKLPQKEIEYIYNWLWDMQNKWKTSFRDKWKRKIEIGKKFRESSYKKENDVYKVYWKNHEVGEYIGPGAPKQFKSFNEIQPNSTDIRFVETSIKK